MIDKQLLIGFAPYLICVLSLLGGTLAGIFLSVLMKRGKIQGIVRDRLTVFVALTVWFFMTFLFWVISQNNPIVNKINNGGGLS